jgi:hypothetical protein
MQKAFNFFDASLLGGTMKRTVLFLTLSIIATSPYVVAQSTPGPQSAVHEGYTSTAAVRQPAAMGSPSIAPFSRLAFGGGISPMGINLQAAVNASRHINVRGVGNVFNYSLNNFTTNGMNLNGKINLASAGVSLDVYPFPNHGFRLSPGALFYNQNAATADVTVAGGTSFELNGVTYYASSTNPITGNGSLGLHTRNPAFTMTTGWGNMISRRGSHFSVPVEVGAAFIGTPALNIALTGGQACDQFGLNCVNVATDPTVQANLQAQIQKYKDDINPFQYYPIVSVGVAYNFNLRSNSGTR